MYERNRFVSKRVSRRALIVAGITGIVLTVAFLLFPNKTPPILIEIPKIAPDDARLRNRRLIVTNTDLYGFVSVDTDIIVLRLSQTDPDPLRTVSLLHKVGNIDETLVIVSHDSLDAKGVSLLDRIRWCRILQIFYPGKKDAVTHWRWTVRQVMSRLPWSKKYRGLVVLLESGEVPSPDILHLLLYMREASHYFPAPRLLSLAGVKENQTIFSSSYLTIVPWSPRLLQGVAIDRRTWQQLSSTCALPQTVVSVLCSRVTPPSQPQVTCKDDFFPDRVHLVIQLDGVHIVNKTEQLQYEPYDDPRDFFWCRRNINKLYYSTLPYKR